MLHGAGICIYQHLPHKSPSSVAKYTSTMEHLGRLICSLKICNCTEERCPVIKLCTEEISPEQLETCWSLSRIGSREHNLFFVGKTIINHPLGNGLYNQFMVIWEMVYDIALPTLPWKQYLLISWEMFTPCAVCTFNIQYNMLTSQLPIYG